jgi:hypothetical protein
MAPIEKVRLRATGFRQIGQCACIARPGEKDSPHLMDRHQNRRTRDCVDLGQMLRPFASFK